MIKKSNFTLHVIKGYLGDTVLAEYNHGIFIFDGGCRSDVKRIETFMNSSLKKPISSIKLIFVSHTHPDHAGGAVMLSKKYSIPLAASSRINDWYRGPGGAVQHKIDTLMGYWVALKSRKMGIENIFYRRKIPVQYTLRAGSTLPMFDDWEVIETPGHTSHDIALFNTEEGCLYIGDVFIKMKGKFLLPFPVSFPAAMKRTLNALKNCKVNTLILPHGGVVRVNNFQHILNKLLKRLDMGLNKHWKRMMVFQRFSREVRKKDYNK